MKIFRLHFISNSSFSHCWHKPVGRPSKKFGHGRFQHDQEKKNFMGLLKKDKVRQDEKQATEA